MRAAAADEPATIKSPPPSPRDPADELLLSDATAGVTATTHDAAASTGGATLTHQLPPLNLSAAHRTYTPQGSIHPPSRSQPSTTTPVSSTLAPPRPPPHKSSFSVPPSSRAAHTFSVLDTDHSDALHARTANYETLLRQFSLPRHTSAAHAARRRATSLGATRRMFRPPSVSASAYAVPAAPTGRMHRTSSAEDLRNSLSRLGSSFALDRIRRRSVEGSGHAVADGRTSDSDAAGGSFRGLHSRRRVSITRTIRRTRLRTGRFLSRLTEPISPLGTASLVHQLAVLALLIVQLLYTPFAASFLVLRRDVGTRRTMVSANIALELAWLVDIALRLNTAVVVPSAASPHSPSLITSRGELARRYLRSGAFAVDLVSALPLETVFWLTTASSALALVDRHETLYHVGNALRLLKLRLAAPALRAVQQSLPTNIATTIPIMALAALQTVVTLAGTVHYLACAWHAVLFMDHDAELPRLAQSYVHAVVEMSLLLVGDGSTATHAVQDHSNADGHTALARDLFVLGVVVLGVVLSALVFARLAVALLLSATHARETNAAHTLERALAELTTRMDRLELPAKLQQRVAQYYTHVWEAYRVLPASSTHEPLVLAGLSPPLALEVALSRYAATLGRLPLWKGCSADLLSALLVAVTARVYLRDDFVLRKGERARELLVLQCGACEAMTSSSSSGLTSPPGAEPAGPGSGPGSPLKVGAFQAPTASSLPVPERLTAGAALGQLALLVDYKSPAYVRAVGPLEVAVLTRDAFEELLHRFADDRTGLVRRVLRGGLETGECAALTQLAGLSPSPPQPQQPPVCGPSTREAAKRLVRMLGIDTLAAHQRLRLPLSLEAPVMPSIHGQNHHQAALRRTITPADRVHATSDAGAASESPTTIVTTATATGTTTGTTTRPSELDALAQTHETLLQLVTHLSDTTARLDAKLARMEERAHRAEDAARFAAASNGHQTSVLLRRRSSLRSSVEPTTSLHRRPSNVTSLAPSESGASQDTSRVEFQAPRMLLPEEIAALEATAAMVTESKSSSFHEEHDTLVSLPPDTLLDAQGGHMDTLSASEVRRAMARRAATRSPQSVARSAASTRSRSLGVSTRQRLALFQQALTGIDPAVGAARRPSLSAMWSRKTTDA